LVTNLFCAYFSCVLTIKASFHFRRKYTVVPSLKTHCATGETVLEALIRNGLVNDNSDYLHCPHRIEGMAVASATFDLKHMFKNKPAKLQVSDKIVLLCGGHWDERCFKELNYDRILKWTRIKSFRRSSVRSNEASGAFKSPTRSRRLRGNTRNYPGKVLARAEAAKMASRIGKWPREIRRQKDHTARVIPASFFDTFDSHWTLGDDANLLEAFLMKSIKLENTSLPESLSQSSVDVQGRYLTPKEQQIVLQAPNATYRDGTISCFDIDHSELSAHAAGNSKRMGRSRGRLNLLLQRYTSLRHIASVMISSRSVYADRTIGILLNKTLQRAVQTDAVEAHAFSRVLQLYLTEDEKSRLVLLKALRCFPIDVIRKVQREMFNLKWLKISADGSGFEFTSFFRFLVMQGAFCQALSEAVDSVTSGRGNQGLVCRSSDTLSMSHALAKLSCMSLSLSIHDPEPESGQARGSVATVETKLCLSSDGVDSNQSPLVIGAVGTGLFARHINRVTLSVSNTCNLLNSNSVTAATCQSSGPSSSPSTSPWVNSDGHRIDTIFKTMREKVLSILMQRPGSSLASVHAFMPFLTLSQTSELLTALKLDGTVYERSVPRVGAHVLTDPFASYKPIRHYDNSGLGELGNEQSQSFFVSLR